MGATSISWRTTTTVIITILQIQALISVEVTTVTGVEGQTFSFRCEYENSQRNNAKYFCYEHGNDPLIRTEKHDEWESKGRFSLYDNTTGAFFTVRVNKLTLKDSRTYQCGVDVSFRPDYITFIKLNVFQANPPAILTHQTPTSPNKDLAIIKHHLPLFMTAVICIAMLFMCLFTLCLLLAVKQRGPRPRHNREISSDYETMMPGVRTEPELRCSCSDPDCTDQSDLPPPPPPPDLCSHFTPKQRDSTVTLGLSEYVDMDVPKHVCQYQHLDLSRLEEHVYHSLHGNGDPKDGPQRVKEQIKC